MGSKTFLLSGPLNASTSVASGPPEIEGKSVRVGPEGLDSSLCSANVYLEAEITSYSWFYSSKLHFPHLKSDDHCTCLTGLSWEVNERILVAMPGMYTFSLNVGQLTYMRTLLSNQKLEHVFWKSKYTNGVNETEYLKILSIGHGCGGLYKEA